MKAATIAIAALALMLTACRAPRPIVQESARRAADTVYIAKERVDTIAVRDSVAADTSGRVIYRERQVWRTRTRTDTVYVAHERADTVFVTLPAEPQSVHGGGRSLLAFALLASAAAIILLRLRP